MSVVTKNARTAHLSLGSVLIYVLIGVLATILTAWVVALWTPASSLGRAVQYRHNVSWPVNLPGWPPALYMVETQAPGLTSYSYEHGLTGIVRPHAEVIHCGWPFRSLRYTWIAESYPLPGLTNGLPALGLERDEQFSRRLPLIPIIPGFAVNVVLYAAMAWVVSSAMVSLRRATRARRGRCPECSYPLVDSDGGRSTCPECGTVFDTRQP
jgi:hypothetical protein